MINKQELITEIETCHQELTRPGVVVSRDFTLSERAVEYFDMAVRVSAKLDLYPLRDNTHILHPLNDGWWLLEINPDEFTFVDTSAHHIDVTDYAPAYIAVLVVLVQENGI